MQSCLLIFQECFEGILEFFAKIWNGTDKNDGFIDQRLIERNDDKDFLYMHFYHSFTNQCGTEECPKWYQEMSTRYARQIEQRIWNLKCFITIIAVTCSITKM